MMIFSFFAPLWCFFDADDFYLHSDSAILFTRADYPVLMAETKYPFSSE